MSESNDAWIEREQARAEAAMDAMTVGQIAEYWIGGNDVAGLRVYGRGAGLDQKRKALAADIQAAIDAETRACIEIINRQIEAERNVPDGHRHHTGIAELARNSIIKRLER